MSAPSLLTWAILLALVLHAAWRQWRHASPLKDSPASGRLRGRGLSPYRRGTVSSTRYNHFSLLRTIEMLLGVPTQTANDAAAVPMTDMLR